MPLEAQHIAGTVPVGIAVALSHPRSRSLGSAKVAASKMGSRLAASTDRVGLAAKRALEASKALAAAAEGGDP